MPLEHELLKLYEASSDSCTTASILPLSTLKILQFIYPLSCDYFNLNIFIPCLPSIPPQTSMPTSFSSLAFPNVKNFPFMSSIFIVSPEMHDFITYVVIFHPTSSISCLSLYISISIILYHISLSYIFSQRTPSSHSPFLNFCYKLKFMSMILFYYASGY